MGLFRRWRSRQTVPPPIEPPYQRVGRPFTGAVGNGDNKATNIRTGRSSYVVPPKGVDPVMDAWLELYE